MQKSTLINFFENLGLEKDAVVICTELSTNSELTILELARKTQLDRSKVYRLVNNLADKGFLRIIVDANGQRVRIGDLENLKEKVNKRFEEGRELQKIFPELEVFLQSSGTFEQTGTKVLFYKGEETVKQMFWNTLSAKEPILGYTYKDAVSITGEEFALKWHDEFIRRNLKLRHLYNESYLKNNADDPVEKVLKQKYRNYNHIFDGRLISSKVLKITTQMDIYDETVSFYKWYEEEVYGVEIKNKELVNMQKQIFEIVWEKASPL